MYAKQREERLRRRRDRDRATRAALSAEQRQALLQRKGYRVNNETSQQSEARLRQMSAQRAERLATE